MKLEGYGLQAQTYTLNKAAAEISKAAAGNKALVLGSMGPDQRRDLRRKLELLGGLQRCKGPGSEGLHTHLS